MVVVGEWASKRRLLRAQSFGFAKMVRSTRVALVLSASQAEMLLLHYLLTKWLTNMD